MSKLSVKVFAADKTLDVDGEVAVGEQVAVAVEFEDVVVADASTMRLRVRHMNADVAVFPLVLPDPEAGTEGDAWTPDATAPAGTRWTATLNLNTVQLRAAFGARPCDGASIGALLMVDCFAEGGAALHALGKTRIRWWDANETITGIDGAPDPVDIGEWATEIAERMTDAESDIAEHEAAIGELQRKAMTKDMLRTALTSVLVPGPTATQKEVRLIVTALVNALKGLCLSVLVAFLMAGCGLAFAETLAWEDVPPGTEVDTDALKVLPETDPVWKAEKGDYARIDHTHPTDISRAAADDISAAYAAPRAYYHFREKYAVADTDTLILYADGTAATNDVATLSGADVRQHGGAVAIYGGTNLKKLDTNYGTTNGQPFAPILCAVVCPEVTDFGYMALANCIRLVRIDIPKCVNAGTTNWDAPYALAATAIEEIELPQATFVGYGVFLQNYMLRKVSVPAAARVHQHAFENCAALELVDFGNALEAVPSIDHSNAFKNTPDDLAIVVPDALYEEWITSGHWATVAETKHIYRHSDWMQTRGGGIPINDFSSRGELAAVAQAATNYTDEAIAASGGGGSRRSVSPWAFPGDWRIVFENLAPQTATNATVSTYRDIYSRVANSSGWYYNVLVSAVAEERSLDDADAIADVSFYIREDPSGAVGSFTNNVITSSGLAGAVVVTGIDTNGDEKSSAISFAPVGDQVLLERWHAEDDGTERFIWMTNAWARLAAVSTNEEDMITIRHCRTKATQFSKVDAAGAAPWPVPRALNLWGTGGRIVEEEWPGITAAGVRNYCTVLNGDFFWPELQTNLWCFSISCHEVNSNNDGCPALAIAPHYIICANHYPGKGMWQWGRHPDRAPRFRYGPGTNDIIFCSSRTLVAGDGSVTKMGPVGSDIAVVRLPNNITLPDHIICKFAKKDVLDRLSLTQFERTTGWTINGHQVITPCVITGHGSSRVMWNGDKWDFEAGQKNWYAMPEADIPANVRNFEHFDHMYDSGSPHFLVSPKGQVIPWFQVYGASAGSATAAYGANGPAYTDDVLKELSNIVFADSGGREDIRYWTFEELWSGVGTNNLEVAQ